MVAAIRGLNRNFVVVFIGLLFALSLPIFFKFIKLMGQNIDQADMASDYIKGWVAAMLLFIPILAFRFSHEDKRNLSILWAMKIFVCLGFMLIYEYAYGLDAYYYFTLSQDRYVDTSHVEIGNGSANLAYFLWLFEHEIYRTHSYHTQKIIISFIGLMGVFSFYRGVRKFSPNIPHKFLLFFGLFPSVLFWSSILGKDPIILFGICFTFYGMFRFTISRNPLYIPFIIMGMAVVAAIRTWMVPILLVPYTVGSAIKIKNIFFRAAIFAVILGGTGVAVQKLSSKFAFENEEQATKTIGSISRSWNKGGSAGDVPVITSVGDAVRFLPYGMFTALFRPLPGEVLNPFGTLAGLENLVMLYLLYKGIRRLKAKDWLDPLIVWLLVFVILWSMLYAFISPQNLGAAVRFRLQVLPGLLTLLAYIAYFKPRSDDSN